MIYVNSTIETILEHRSIRHFKEEKLTKEQIHILVNAAQHGSTSSFYQAYNIIGITDPHLKQELRKISGQSYVEHNGHFFLFCANLNRFTTLADQETIEKMKENLSNTEHFIVGIVDATIAAQNLAIAAESMGLGICYIGSIRNNIEKVDELLNLPPYVIPIFGMAVGYPESTPEKKPRLPMDVIYHENAYNENQEDSIREYNKVLAEYYEQRSSNQRKDTWTAQIERKLANPIRTDVGPYVRKKGVNKY